MARPPKGGDSARPPPPGKDESWESIEEAWDGIEGNWTNPAAPRGERGDPSGLSTLQMEGKQPKLTPVPVAGDAEEALEAQVTQVDPLSPPVDGRDLPVAPPGHRRVSRTIVGVGTHDLQALMQAERAMRGGPAKQLESSADRARVFAAPPPEELATVRTPPPDAFTAPRTPSDEIATVVRHEGEVSADPVAPVNTEMTPLGRTDPLPVAKTDPLLAVDVQTDPISVPDSIQTPAPTVAPPREPSWAPMPAGRPASISSPRVVSSRFRPPETSRVDHGPSNFTLALLWAVAIASVGLAVFLYATR